VTDSSSDEGDDLFFQQAQFVDDSVGDSLAFENDEYGTRTYEDLFEADRKAALAATSALDDVAGEDFDVGDATTEFVKPHKSKSSSSKSKKKKSSSSSSKKKKGSSSKSKKTTENRAVPNDKVDAVPAVTEDPVVVSTPAAPAADAEVIPAIYGLDDDDDDDDNTAAAVGAAAAAVAAADDDEGDSSSSSSSTSLSTAATVAAEEPRPLSLDTVDNDALLEFIRAQVLPRCKEYRDEVLLVLGCRHRKSIVPTKQGAAANAVDSTEVFVALDEKKLTPRKLKANYVVIVTRHRLYMIKAKMAGLLRKTLTMKLVRDLHWFLLRRVRMSVHAYCADVVVLQFAGKLGAVCLRTPRMQLLLDTVRRAHRRITVGLPRALAPVIDLPQALVSDVSDPVPALPARGFRECYLAHCDVRRVTPNDECALLACEAVDGRTFDLALLPGIDGAEEENDCDWAPLMAALKYNDYFRVLELRNVNLRDRVVKLAVSHEDRAMEVASTSKKKVTNALNAVVDVLATNRFITKLVLRDTGVSNFAELSTALIANKHSALSHIDLSSNKLSKASIVGLCRALRARPIGLRSLLLSKANVTAQGIVLLVAALRSHLRASLAIEHLDLSHNELTAKGSIAVSQFLVCFKGCGRLTWLNLCQTSLDIASIAPVLGVIPTLQHVDLSNNQLAPAAAADDHVVGALCDVVKLPHMRSASFAGMRLSGKAVQAILLACRATPQQRDERRLALDLSSNELTPRDVDALCAALAPVRLALVSLSLADCRISAAGLDALLTALQRSDRLERVCLGGNATETNKETRVVAVDVVSSIINFVVSHPAMRELDLQRNVALRGTMETLFQSLKAMRLQTLVVSGIPVSDAAMSALAVSLRINRWLVTLDLTDCRVSLSGWQSLRAALRQNAALQHLRLATGSSPFETLDAFRRAVPSSYTGRRLQLKEVEVFALYEDVRASLSRNRQAAAHEAAAAAATAAAAVEDKRTLYDVLSPALLPAPGLVEFVALPPHLSDSSDPSLFDEEIAKFQQDLEAASAGGK
jgi:Ran GTPase-activating protein (RanGAP) involved in mRNA processing and transport